MKKLRVLIILTIFLAILLLVVGYPAEGLTLPDIERKPLEAIATFFPPDGA